MKGKAQLILTDPDSGRVVKRTEESNMVTNAIQKIFDVPKQAILRGNTSEIYEGFMPIYKYLVSGLVMLGNNIEENPDKFMIPEDSIFVGSAGTQYTGTSPFRGTLNASQSGEIDGGYRFVWDFAPEKAVGEIRCIGLTNRWFGDTEFIINNTDGRILINPQNIYYGSSGGFIECFTSKGTILGFLDGDRAMYSVSVYGNIVTVNRSRVPDYSAIRLGDSIDSFRNMEIIRTDEYTLPISANDYKSWAFDKPNGLLYVFETYHSSPDECESVKYCAINVKNGEIKRQGVFNWMPKHYPASDYFGVRDNKIYISKEGDMRVFSMSGEQLENIDFGDWVSVIPMFSGGGKSVLIYDGYTGSCFSVYPSQESKVYIESPYMMQQQGIVDLPYVLAHYLYNNDAITTYVMLRTDYLATINNLAEPLVKTDRHALQVRYEITNE